MDFSQENLDPANEHLNLGGWVSAPREVFAAMMTLADPADVVASLRDRVGSRESESEAEHTEWRVLWLTESRLVFCSAKAPHPSWDFSDRLPEVEPILEAWSVPLSAVAAIGVCSVRTSPGLGPRWSANVVHEVRLDGPVERLTVPLFGGFSSLSQAGDTESVLSVLTAALGSRAQL